MTWAEMVREPRLGDLYAEASYSRKPGSSPNDIWYRSFKPRLVRLVGFGAAQSELRSTDAYDTAYDAVYAALSSPRRKLRCP